MHTQPTQTKGKVGHRLIKTQLKGMNMKTMSYVKAVTMAVNRMENAPDDGWFWVNRWASNMVIKPRLSLFREI